MRTLTYLVLMVLISVAFSCNSSKSAATPEQLATLEQLLKDRNFETISDTAYPLATNAMNAVQNSGLIRPGSNVSRISLIGNPNYLRIIGDSIYAELPYYGERQMNVKFNSTSSAISIRDVVKDFKLIKNRKGDGYTVSFDAQKDVESFSFTIEVFPDQNTMMSVSGTTRFSIRYAGHLKRLK